MRHEAAQSFSIAFPSWTQALPAADVAAQVASALCGLKVALALAVPVFLMTGQSGPAAIATTLAIVADIADGIVFKRSTLHAERHWRDRRRIFDAATDRIVVAAVLTPLFLLGAIPVAFFALVTVRELLTALAVGVPYLRSGLVYSPNLAARTSLLLVGVQAILSIIGITVVSEMYLTISLLSAVGILLYCVAPHHT